MPPEIIVVAWLIDTSLKEIIF